jgi:hypothetical protein
MHLFSSMNEQYLLRYYVNVTKIWKKRGNALLEKISKSIFWTFFHFIHIIKQAWLIRIPYWKWRKTVNFTVKNKFKKAILTSIWLQYIEVLIAWPYLKKLEIFLRVFSVRGAISAEIWCRSDQIQALGEFLNLAGLIRPRPR